jgi:hypothetical protein
MTAALAVILSIALVVSPLPVGAQVVAKATRARAMLGANEAAGPIARAAAYEGARLVGCQSTKSGAPHTQSNVNWKKVREIGRGRPITLTVRDGTVVAGRFIRADEERLLVLVLQPGLKPSQENLIAMAIEADIWNHAEQDWSVTFSGKMLVTSEGVFSAAKVKLADLRTFPRRDVTAVERPGMGMGKKIAIGIGLFFLGMIMISAIACRGGACA